jgi:Flp pilus assembly pilin Flp
MTVPALYFRKPLSFESQALGMRAFAHYFRRDVRGAVASEYAFLIVFIALLGAVGMIVFGLSLSDLFDTLGVDLSDICVDDGKGTPCFVFDLPGKKKGL